MTQQGTTIFATWFTYDVNHNPLWYSVTATQTAPNTFIGTVHTTGPAYSAVPFDPTNVQHTAVGTATFMFSDGNTGRFAYQVNDGGERRDADQGDHPRGIPRARDRVRVTCSFLGTMLRTNGAPYADR